MYSWNEVVEERARNKKKKNKNIIITVVLVLLCGVNLYAYSIPRIVHGTAVISDPYLNLKNIAAEQIAVTDVGALHYSGTLYPTGTGEYSIDIISLFTGELYGTVTQGDLKAKVLGVAGRTYLYADPEMWRGLTGHGEYGDGYALASVMFQHWVLIPTGLLGYDIGRDFLPAQFAQLLGNTSENLKVSLSENTATSSTAQLIKVSLEGKVRPEYRRDVKADLEIDYPRDDAIKAMLKDYSSAVNRINGHNGGAGLIANGRTEWHATTPTFQHCQPTKRCLITFTYNIDSQSLGLPKKTPAMIDFVLTARHGSSIVGECRMVRSAIATDREVTKHCSMFIKPDSSIPAAGRHKKVTMPNWDDELQVTLSSVAIQGVPEIYEARRKAHEDLRDVKKYTGAKEDFVWSINTVTNFTGDDADFSRYVTGLEPSIQYQVNDQAFPGYSARSFIVPIGPSYANMVIKNHNQINYSSDWATSDQAQSLLDMAKKQIDALPDPDQYSILWYTPSSEQTIAMKKFLGSHHLLTGWQRIHRHNKYVHRINVVTLPPLRLMT